MGYKSKYNHGIGGWRVPTAKGSNFLQTGEWASIIMNTLDNSDDTISQTKLPNSNFILLVNFSG